MKKIVLGAVVGFLLGSAVTVVANIRVVGVVGYLFGWDVKINGNKLCSDPWVDGTFREIECN